MFDVTSQLLLGLDKPDGINSYSLGMAAGINEPLSIGFANSVYLNTLPLSVEKIFLASGNQTKNRV